ncbi:MAG TPA: hypothetical protein VFU05_01795 [Cyclobacteriaceae bacterium]|nr:hypothetical protein [Cyclobacteriaceae bacterium]
MSAIAKMRFMKFILGGFGLFFGLILGAIYIGIPTIQDRYLEHETRNQTFVAFTDSSTKCEIKVIPEILDRLIVEAKFDHVSGGQEIVKDLKIKILVDNKEQERIFDIYITKFIKPTMSFDEARINDFNELPTNSKYRDFSFIIRPQYKLDNDKEFELQLTAVLADTLTDRERTVHKKFTIINDKEFKFEKFRGH